MKNKIERCAILGMGALGMLFGSVIEAHEKGIVDFLVDPARMKKYRDKPCVVNGQEIQFHLQDASFAEHYDLVIVAVKYQALQPALDELSKAVGPDTILISVMNGIDSEKIPSKHSSPPGQSFRGTVSTGLRFWGLTVQN